MKAVLHPHSPWRIFAGSMVLTVGSVAALWQFMGINSVLVALVLVAVEVAFSFDNAIVNAKILRHMSPFWQRMFLTVGALVAVFGMRLVFPVLLVVMTSGLPWHEVIDLALHHPAAYAHELELAHVMLSSFGGAFLLMLALHFFIDERRTVLWHERLERRMQLYASWLPAFWVVSIVVIASILPFNHETRDTLVAGISGVVVYLAIHGMNEYIGRLQAKQSGAALRTGMAGLASFLYLEILDASFSFDGVLGAFAVTKDVILIAVGLGVGALWVRSLTIFMVRRGTLENYKYIEHGAHYTIAILAAILIVSIFVDVPEVLTGLIGLGIIGSSVVASRQALHASHKAGSAATVE